MTYQVRFLDEAIRDLARLDKSVARRIVERVRWLAENIETARLETLTGELAGFHKLRAGDYRVIYLILHDEQTLVVNAVGHRREIYRTR
jgi:mRNA interferase RelE/StbE